MRREVLIPFVSPIALIVLGLFLWRGLGTPAEEVVPGENLYREVMRTAQEHYVVDVDPEELAFAAAQGLLQHLDRHSRVYTADEFSAQRATSQGQYAGVGVLVGVIEQRVVALEVNPRGPAARAGMKDGDTFLAIAGNEVTAPEAGGSVNDAVKALRGPDGTVVRVKVEPLGGGTPRELAIERGTVPAINTFGYRIGADDAFGYVCIEAFRGNTLAQFDRVLQGFAGAPLDGLVLDLRGNRGGNLEAALEIADRFLPEGLGVSTVGRAGTREYRTSDGEDDLDHALVVLVDQRSASASEVLAGALQDRGRAVLVGERTYGKGVVQEVGRLRSREGAGIKITTRHYYTPAGRSIESRVALPGRKERLGGLAPDVVVRSGRVDRSRDELARERRRLDPRIQELLRAAEPAQGSHEDEEMKVALTLLTGGAAPDRSLGSTPQR